MCMRRNQLEEQNIRYDTLMEDLSKTHKIELEKLRQQSVAERESLRAEMAERHQKEREDAQCANQLAVEALKQSLQLQGQEEMERERQQHNRRMANLQVELREDHEKEKRDLRKESALEIQKHQKQVEKLLAERIKEVSIVCGVCVRCT